MRVHLTSASDFGLSALHRVEQCAKVDRFRTHTLSSDPDAADVILFVETDQDIGPFGMRLRRHPLVRRMPDKCFAYNSSDRPVAHLPGLYASIDKKRYDPTRVRTAHFLSTHYMVPEPKTKPTEQRRLLYSFVGAARNARVRQELMSLRHDRGECIDTSERGMRVWDDPVQRSKFMDEYASILADTKFALCPRGCGASSIRLFEAMRVGCVPVVLSDAWVPPSGPDWSAFSLRVAERDVSTLPRLLERLEPTVEAKSVIAQQVWSDWFSDEVTFHRLVEWCLEIQRSRARNPNPPTTGWLTLTEPLWPGNALPTLRWLRSRARSEFNSRVRGGRG